MLQEQPNPKKMRRNNEIAHNRTKATPKSKIWMTKSKDRDSNFMISVSSSKAQRAIEKREGMTLWCRPNLVMTYETCSTCSTWLHSTSIIFRKMFYHHQFSLIINSTQTKPTVFSRVSLFNASSYGYFLFVWAEHVAFTCLWHSYRCIIWTQSIGYDAGEMSCTILVSVDIQTVLLVYSIYWVLYVIHVFSQPVVLYCLIRKFDHRRSSGVFYTTYIRLGTVYVRSDHFISGTSEYSDDDIWIWDEGNKQSASVKIWYLYKIVYSIHRQKWYNKRVKRMVYGFI